MAQRRGERVSRDLRSDYMLDELLTFLGDPIFQVPVRTYMEENSIIFDIHQERLAEHKEVWLKYKRLISLLIAGFCHDVRCSPEEVSEGISSLNKNASLREYYQSIFEQIISVDNFEVFFHMMIECNRRLQQQVILMILKEQGRLPDCLTAEQVAAILAGKPVPQAVKVASSGSRQKPSRQPAGSSFPAPPTSLFEQDDGEVLAIVMSKSQPKSSPDFSEEQILAMQEQVATLEEERKDVEVKLEKLVLRDQTHPESRPTPPPPPPPEVGKGADDVQEWIDDAKEEASFNSSASLIALLGSTKKMSKEEIARRQTYMKQQRDKLLQMKKAEREKKLTFSTEGNPERPRSARSARSAMKEDVPDSNQDDKRQLEMRKAIANSLKKEGLVRPY